MRWLTALDVHKDPRGMSPDMSITPAPSTPTIWGHTAHIPAEDHEPAPVSASAARIRPSLSPAIQRHDLWHGCGALRGNADPILHLLLLHLSRGKRQQGPDSTPFRARGTGPS